MYTDGVGGGGEPPSNLEMCHFAVAKMAAQCIFAGQLTEPRAIWPASVAKKKVTGQTFAGQSSDTAHKYNERTSLVTPPSCYITRTSEKVSAICENIVGVEYSFAAFAFNWL